MPYILIAINVCFTNSLVFEESSKVHRNSLQFGIKIHWPYAADVKDQLSDLIISFFSQQ